MDARVNQEKHGDPKNGCWVMGRVCQSFHTLTQQARHPSSGLSVERTSFFHIFQAILSHPPLLLSRLPFHPVFTSNTRARKFRFFENFGDFLLVENFLSYQQVVNNGMFSTQFFGKTSAR